MPCFFVHRLVAYLHEFLMSWHISSISSHICVYATRLQLVVLIKSLREINQKATTHIERNGIKCLGHVALCQKSLRL